MRLFLIFTFCIYLVARENPFVLPDEPKRVQKVYMVDDENKSNKSDIKVDLKVIEAVISDKQITIKSNNRLKSSFFTQRPTKGVFDFYSKKTFPTKIKRLNSDYFKNIAIGAHKGYYRVAIELDSMCKNPKIEGLSIICN